MQPGLSGNSWVYLCNCILLQLQLQLQHLSVKCPNKLRKSKTWAGNKFKTCKFCFETETFYEGYIWTTE